MKTESIEVEHNAKPKPGHWLTLSPRFQCDTARRTQLPSRIARIRSARSSSTYPQLRTHGTPNAVPLHATLRTHALALTSTIRCRTPHSPTRTSLSHTSSAAAPKRHTALSPAAIFAHPPTLTSHTQNTEISSKHPHRCTRRPQCTLSSDPRSPSTLPLPTHPHTNLPPGKHRSSRPAR